MSRPDLPPPISDLWQSLEVLGFSIAREQYRDDAFGNWFAVVTRGDTGVRFVLDRGHWSVDAGGGDGNWYSPATWRAYFDGRPNQNVDFTLIQECQEVLGMIDEISTSLSTDPHVWSRLREYSVEIYRARRRQHGGQ